MLDADPPGCARMLDRVVEHPVRVGRAAAMFWRNAVTWGDEVADSAQLIERLRTLEADDPDERRSVGAPPDGVVANREVAMSDDKELARAAIDAMHEAFGEHDGRVVHVKGAWAEGTFTATPEGGALCRAPFLRGTPVPALVRFSNGGGNPIAHDGDRGGRGIAVKLYLDDGARTDLLGISVPFFTARTPEDFVAYVRLARRDPETGQPDMAAIGAFLEAHPETAAALGRPARSRRPRAG